VTVRRPNFSPEPFIAVRDAAKLSEVGLPPTHFVASVVQIAEGDYK
jgi:hypothetical protein